eukprot:206987-Pyramimonas_sp.AAC.1
MAASRKHIRYCLHRLLLDEAAEGDWRCMLTYSRGDATNSQRWQKSKLRVHEVETHFILDGFGDSADYAAVLDGVVSRRSTGTLLVVGEGSGEAVYALNNEQDQSTGADTLDHGLQALALLDAESDGDRDD